jgi:hypothetical protein
MKSRTTLAGLGTLALILGACGGESEPASEPPAAEPAAAPSAPTPRVEITAPLEGDSVTGPSVIVRLAAHGFTVVPAGDTTPNSGHHHLFLDRDVSSAVTAIPAEQGFIIHLGNGADTLVIATVAPGEHRLIAVVGDAGHVPVNAILADTVRFVVR